MTPDPSATPADVFKPKVPRGRTLAIQIIGFLLGLGLLAWCIRLALAPNNRENLQLLFHADPGTLTLAIGLSLATLILNGSTFYTAIFPVRRVPFLDIQATNAAASVLNYIPFKLGAVMRFIVHNRRNGVPLLTIGAWIGAVTITMLAALVPLVAAAAWRKHVDALFVVALIAGMLVTGGALCLAARALAHDTGLARIHRLGTRSRLLGKVVRSRPFENLHEGFAMLAHPGALSAGITLRAIDLMIQAARFMVIAHLLNHPLNFEGALLVSGTYFLTAVVSPAGSLGTREGLTAAVGSLAALPDMSSQDLATIALAITATEMIVNVPCGMAGLLFLRPDRLLSGKGPAAAAPA